MYTRTYSATMTSVLAPPEVELEPLAREAQRLPRFRISGNALKLLLLLCGTVLAQGYHLGTDDSAIYLPAVKKVFDPQLYPFGAEFFLSHAGLSFFPQVVGGSARLLHLPVDAAIFLWHLLGVWFVLLAGWRIACACFVSERARWSAVGLLAALLSLPVAGTALIIMDPYLTARSLSTPLTMYAIGEYLHGKRARACAWLLLTALVHPQMSVYGFGFLFFLWCPWRWLAPPMLRARSGMVAAVATSSRLPQGFKLGPAQGEYCEVLHTRDFFFAGQWQWWEWLGVVAPLAMLYAAARMRFRGTLPAFRKVSAAAVPFGVLSTAVFLILSSTDRLENFVRLQPMRSFHVIYILFFLLLGGLLGEYVFCRRRWVAIPFFLLLGTGTFLFDRASFPDSRHVEWPGAASHNPWLEAFAWIRANTPKDAVFALDPRYLFLPGEDLHGFRAVAERSVLADEIKDSGAGSLFPQLADDWKQQQDAQRGWKHFRLADFERLRREYPVSWVVVQRPAPAGLECPYSNQAVLVCRIPAE